MLPNLNAYPPGIPKLTTSSVILPAVVASAASSNGLISAKNFSTLSADLVPNPKSIKLAPNDANPSGILNTPEARPDKTDLVVLILLLSSAGIVWEGSLTGSFIPNSLLNWAFKSTI